MRTVAWCRALPLRVQALLDAAAARPRSPRAPPSGFRLLGVSAYCSPFLRSRRLPARSVARERFTFANLDEVLPLPDLIAIQRDSFQWFLDQGLAETFRDISPVEDFTGQLRLELEFDPTDQDLRPPPKFSVE